MKRKVKRFNGEEDSYVEGSNSDVEAILADAREEYERRKAAKKSDSDDSEDEGTTAEFKRPPKSTADAVHETAKASTPERTSFNSAFAAARKAGDKTFEWRGKTYGTALKSQASPKKAAPKPESVKPAKYESTPVKTSREKITDIVSETPLRNPSGGFHFLNALDRSKRVSGEAMKESGRQARVDRIRRNVGSNLETYGMKKGGKVSSASSRADGCAVRGKTKGRMV